MRTYIEKKLGSLVDRGKTRNTTDLIGPAKKEFSFALGSISFLWQILFFYLPLFLLLMTSVLQITPAGQLKGLTLSHFLPLFKFTFFGIIFNTLGLAFLTAILCFIIAFPLAYCLAFKLGKWKNMVLFLMIIPFWTNFILHIYAWYYVLEGHGILNTVFLSIGIIQTPMHLLNTSGAILLMMVYFFVPFMVLPLFASLERFDPSLLEASLDLGANRLQTICRVLIPIIKNSLRAGFFLVFIPAFGEFVIPELMGGDKFYFVGNVISLFILGENTISVGVAFTVVSAFFLIGCSFMINRWLDKAISFIERTV